MRWVVGSGVAAFVLGFASVAQAAPIVPVSVTASSSYPTYDASYAVDGNALTDWASNSQGAASTLAIDLGADYRLASGTFVDRVTSGGPDGSFFGGLYDYTTSFTLQACTDASCGTLTGSKLTFDKLAPTVHNSPADFAYTADLTGLHGQYFLYSVTGTNGVNPGLSELSFNSVPEAATWAMMIAGVGLAGGALRRRRAGIAFA